MNVYVGILKKAKKEELIMTNDANHMSTIKVFLQILFFMVSRCPFLKGVISELFMCSKNLSSVVQGMSFVVTVLQHVTSPNGSIIYS